VGRGPERGQWQGMPKKPPRPRPLSGVGRGKGSGACVFRGPVRPVTNSSFEITLLDFRWETQVISRSTRDFWPSTKRISQLKSASRFSQLISYCWSSRLTGRQSLLEKIKRFSEPKDKNQVVLYGLDGSGSVLVRY